MGAEGETDFGNCEILEELMEEMEFVLDLNEGTRIFKSCLTNMYACYIYIIYYKILYIIYILSIYYIYNTHTYI